MTSLIQDAARVAAIGIGATAVMDLWQAGMKRLGVPPANFGYVGRWIGHMRHGRWSHASIAKAEPVRGELALGWAVHYAIGVAFAAMLIAIEGRSWAGEPRLLPALAFGIATVAAPLLVMQPAMGAGIASSRTPAPARNTLKSVANHAVFGIGLYLAARILQLFEVTA